MYTGALLISKLRKRNHTPAYR